MEIHMETYIHRILLVGSGMLLSPLVLPWISGWVRQIHRLLEGVLPGRKFRKLSRGTELLTERVGKIELDIDDIRRLLIERLDSNKKKVATPSKNGIATHE